MFRPRTGLLAQLRLLWAKWGIRGRLGWLSRAAEVLACLLLIGLLLPVWCFHWALARFLRGFWLKTLRVYGKDGEALAVPLAVRLELPRVLGVLAFLNSDAMRKSPMLWVVLRGKMSLVGPAPVRTSRIGRLRPGDLRRLDARPGLIDTHFLRKRANIAYEREEDLAREDIERARTSRHAGMLLRAVAGSVLGRRAKRTPDRLQLLGIDMENRSMEGATDAMVEALAAGERRRVFFVNPHCLNVSVKEPAYRHALQAAEWVFPDGIGIHLGCKMNGVALKENLNGTDLFPILCKKLEHRDLGLFLLGGEPGVAAEMVSVLNQRYPGLSIAGFHHGYFGPELNDMLIEDINQSGARILLVAMGVPKQELWIGTHWDRLTVPMAMAVGGLFDFVSGRKPRAPAWMRESGIEWLYRLWLEPGRMWRRYLVGNAVFLMRVWRGRRRKS